MTLIVLGSSSKGNSYILKSSDGEVLILEAGLPLYSVLQYTSYDSIAGVLISHAHGDHAGRMQEFLDAYIDVYIHESFGIKTRDHGSAPFLFAPEEVHHIGKYNVIPFRLYHDIPCFGFLVRHPDMIGNLLFCTDTAHIPYTFGGVQNMLIEADYDEQILARNEIDEKVHPVLAKRIRATHMSIDKAIAFCRNSDLRSIRNIILIHLSDRNSNGDEFRRRMTKETGKTVYIASPGLEIEIGNNPF